MKPQHPPTLDTHDLPKGGFVFAPGVIEGPRRRHWLTDRRVEQLARAVLVLTLLATLAATLVLFAGLPALGSAL